MIMDDDDNDQKADLDENIVCALAIRCSKHDKIALYRLFHDNLDDQHNLDYLWLPYIVRNKKQNDFKWTNVKDVFNDIFKQLFLPSRFVHGKQISIDSFIIQLHSIQRIQLPNGGEFAQRLIYIGEWPTSDLFCCSGCSNTQQQPQQNIRWISIQDILSNDTIRLWGSEVITYASLLQKHRFIDDHNKPQTNFLVYEQTGWKDAFKYLRTQTSKQSNQQIKPSVEMFKELLEKSEYNHAEVLLVYDHYVRHCYPSRDMSYWSFESFIKKHLPWFHNPKQCKKMFKAMNYKHKNYLGFQEFLLGMVCLDPATPNLTPRHMFLYRYYCEDSQLHNGGCMSARDIQFLNKDLSGTGTIVPSNRKYNFETFSKEIQNGTLKETEKLCRLKKSLIQILTMDGSIINIFTKNNPQTAFGPKLSKNCLKCRHKEYSLATHSVRFDTNSRRLVDPEELNISTENGLAERFSKEYVFNKTCTANYVLDLIRKLSSACSGSLNHERLKQEVINGLSVSIIKTICDDVWELFAIEPRVLKLSTPTIVLGDIHGNIHDLLVFEQQLWPMAPIAPTAHVLFLGDYVDRGESSIEVILYLFAMKILCPNGFSLLRGNHEVRSIQRIFTFERECLDKYGKHGQEVFELINKVFDVLPFAAVVDERIYCAHGGIPFTLNKIDELRRLPIVLQDPEQEAPAVWEILWSDPVTNVEFQEFYHFMNRGRICNTPRDGNASFIDNLVPGSGFLSNVKRSTAFYFAEQATVNFLLANNLSHVIRAHEMVNEGFKFNHSGMVVTVFSCSKYCGAQNKAAAICIETSGNEQNQEQKGFIKIISLDT